MKMIVARGDFHHQIQLANSRLTGEKMPISPFYSVEIPQIDISFYFSVVGRDAGLTEAQAVQVLILLERLCTVAALKGQAVSINSFTIHR